MTTPKTVFRDSWLEQRRALLQREKELTRASDELARARMALPRVRIETDYVFRSVDGPITLTQLFGDQSQLIVQHFMFGADWDEGCPSCSFWADGYNGIEQHLNARDIALAVVSSAPVERINAYRERLGWSFSWVSSGESDFNQDYAVTFSAQSLEASDDPNYNFESSRFNGPEAPGMSVFQKDPDGAIYHTYSTYSRGLERFNPAYQLMDLVPKGRDEGGLAHTMAWLKRRDQY